MGSKDRGVHVRWPHILQSGQSWETQYITLSISSLPLCRPPSITSLSPADLQGPLTGPCYPGTGGNANWFYISYGIFRPSTCYTDCHFRQRYENQREMSECGGTALNTASCLRWSLARGTRYFLMPRCLQTLYYAFDPRDSFLTSPQHEWQGFTLNSG